MSHANYPALLGDVGGTNARFAWCLAPHAPITDVHTLACDHYEGLESAIRDYLKITGLGKPNAASIGIANPVTGDRVQMTNRDWSFSMSTLQENLGLNKLIVLNDFTAVALALQSIQKNDLHQIGGSEAVPNAAIALLGAGTGLGVSGLLPCGNAWTPIQGEGGHVSLTPSNEKEFRVIELLAKQFGHVSAERVLSGPGLSSLYQTLSMLNGNSTNAAILAADISDLALKQKEPLALETLQMFAGFMGSVAGDLALTLGARGGVYIAGGIIPRWLGWFENSSFRERFEAKGRFRSYLNPIPVWVISSTFSPAFIGADCALNQAAE
jgi:glucokinase